MRHTSAHNQHPHAHLYNTNKRTRISSAVSHPGWYLFAPLTSASSMREGSYAVRASLTAWAICGMRKQPDMPRSFSNARCVSWGEGCRIHANLCCMCILIGLCMQMYVCVVMYVCAHADVHAWFMQREARSLMISGIYHTHKKHNTG